MYSIYSLNRTRTAHVCVCVYVSVYAQSALKPLILRLRLSQWCVLVAQKPHRRARTTFTCVCVCARTAVRNRTVTQSSRVRKERAYGVRRQRRRRRRCASPTRCVYVCVCIARLSAEQSDSFTPQKCQLMSLVLVYAGVHLYIELCWRSKLCVCARV